MSSEKINAIILAGGLGTRLKSVMPTLPKALSPINGRPFLDYILDFLEGSDSVNNVILAVGYMADQIIEKYTNRHDYNFKILFSREETLVGTGGAIKMALQYSTTDDIMVLNGDSYVDVRMNDMIAFHREKNSSMTIIVKEIRNSGRYGLIKFDDNNRIYLFKRDIFNNVEENRTISLEKELIPFFINNNDIYGFVTYGEFIDIGIPETYQIADKFFKEELGHK